MNLLLEPFDRIVLFIQFFVCVFAEVIHSFVNGVNLVLVIRFEVLKVLDLLLELFDNRCVVFFELFDFLFVFFFGLLQFEVQ